MEPINALEVLVQNVKQPQQVEKKLGQQILYRTSKTGDPIHLSICLNDKGRSLLGGSWVREVLDIRHSVFLERMTKNDKNAYEALLGFHLTAGLGFTLPLTSIGTICGHDEE